MKTQKQKLSPLPFAGLLALTLLGSSLQTAMAVEKSINTPSFTADNLNETARNYVEKNRAEVEANLLAAFGSQMPDGGEQLAGMLKNATITQLQAAREAQDANILNVILGGTNSDPNLAQRVGDTDKDYSFTPITPCRIIDTRISGGIFLANDTREFNIYGSGGVLETQGGIDTGCAAPAGEPRGAILKLTAVPDPVVAPANNTGTFSVYPANEAAPDFGSIVIYNGRNGNIANTASIQSFFDASAKEVKIKNKFGRSHLVVDVLGYFYAPEVPVGVDYISGNQSFPLSTTDATARTLSVTVPKDSHCVINASGYYALDPNSNARCSITTGTTVDMDHSIYSDNDSTNPHFESWGATRGFQQTAGTTDYNLVCTNTLGTTDVRDTSLTAMCSTSRY